MRRNTFFTTMDVGPNGSQFLEYIYEGGCFYYNPKEPENVKFLCSPLHYAGSTYSFDLRSLNDKEYEKISKVFTTVVSPTFTETRAIIYSDEELVIFMGDYSINEEDKNG